MTDNRFVVLVYLLLVALPLVLTIGSVLFNRRHAPARPDTPRRDYFGDALEAQRRKAASSVRRTP